jgi:shikimate dehydrogenase
MMLSNSLAEHTRLPFDGGCELLFMAGAPVAQVQTPAILNQRFLSEGRRRLVVPLHVSLEGLPTFLEAMRQIKNAVGLLVTMPHKELLCRMSETKSPRAALLGFSNVLRITDEGFFESDCLDGDALIAAIHTQNFDLTHKSVVLVGCGGAGAAYGEALVHAGVTRIDLVDSNARRAENLAEKLSQSSNTAKFNVYNQATDLTADVLINASPIGMYSDQECSFTESDISRAALVVDATSPKWMTKLKQIAEKFNIPSIDGKTLAQAQGDSIVRFFWTD